MAKAKIDKEAELARLDQIFAEIEAQERGEVLPPPAPANDGKSVAEKRLESQPLTQIVGSVRQMLKDDAFKTKWERVLARTLVNVTDNGVFIEAKELAAKNSELNSLRNFATAVEKHLAKAEKTAKEQDNHHYYKIFAEQTKQLLEKL
jgi:hypothetical protein